MLQEVTKLMKSRTKGLVHIFLPDAKQPQEHLQ
jgi:hypothetical protein